MANSKELSKQEEINLLEKLVGGNGYFSEYFGKDLDQMVSNIRNDFPIDMGTSIEKMEIEVRDLKEANSLFEDKIRILRDQVAMLDRINDSQSAVRLKIRDEAVKAGCLEVMTFFEIGEVIEAKLKLGIGLNEDEVKHVISRL